MRARVQTEKDLFIYLDSESIQVHCLACDTWVRLDEVQIITLGDGCQMSECPHCQTLSRFEQSSPAHSDISRARTQFELNPTEARDKILSVLSHMPKRERQITLELLKHV